jgi:mono/diheme cytochrome c family protein
VLYSTQTVSLLVTHENTPPRDANALILRLIVLSVALVTAISIARPQQKREQKPAAKQASVNSGKETFLRYCASCHGENGTGNGPAAGALKPPPSDLTTLSKRHEGKFPAGYVGAVLKFGRSLASHGSEDMPVWGSRFKELDPARDPTGQQHIDDVVVYIESLQAK